MSEKYGVPDMVDTSGDPTCRISSTATVDCIRKGTGSKLVAWNWNDRPRAQVSEFLLSTPADGDGLVLYYKSEAAFIAEEALERKQRENL